MGGASAGESSEPIYAELVREFGDVLAHSRRAAPGRPGTGPDRPPGGAGEAGTAGVAEGGSPEP